MGAPNIRDGADDGEASWASESLPLSVRRELLQRELNKLGFRKGSADAPRAGGQVQQQQQQQPQIPERLQPDADGQAPG